MSEADEDPESRREGKEVDEEGGGEGKPVEIGDYRKKHISITLTSGETLEHGDIYLKHSKEGFAVSPEKSFPEEETTRYRKEEIAKVKIQQHHPHCFITASVTGEREVIGSLCRFRDEVLLKNFLGRSMVRVYYLISPPIAETLTRSPDSVYTNLVRFLVRSSSRLSKVRENVDKRFLATLFSLLITSIYVFGILTAVTGFIGKKGYKFLRKVFKRL